MNSKKALLVKAAAYIYAAAVGITALVYGGKILDANSGRYGSSSLNTTAVLIIIFGLVFAFVGAALMLGFAELLENTSDIKDAMKNQNTVTGNKDTAIPQTSEVKTAAADAANTPEIRTGIKSEPQTPVFVQKKADEQIRNFDLPQPQASDFGQKKTEEQVQNYEKPQIKEQAPDPVPFRNDEQPQTDSKTQNDQPPQMEIKPQNEPGPWMRPAQKTELQMKQDAYQYAVSRQMTAKTNEDVAHVAQIFQNLGDFQDAQYRYQQCMFYLKNNGRNH